MRSVWFKHDVMLFSRSNWPRHRPWCFIFLAGTLGSALWYFAASRGQPVWPGGSSLPGFTFGVIGSLVIIFEFSYWTHRKKNESQVPPPGSSLCAHIWLGLLTLPLVWFHSGQRLGGWLSTVL